MEKAVAQPSVETHQVFRADTGAGDRALYRFGAISAVLGVVIAIVRQLWETFHPATATGDQQVAFAEYAAHEHWVAAHLVEFFGWALVVAGLVVLSWKLRSGKAGGWAFLGAAGAVATMALMAGLQAIDGIALKVMVDRWSAGGGSRELFEGAYIVRQLEGGFLAMFILMLSLTAIIYGIALLVDRKSPNWLGRVGVASGCMTIPLSVVLALDPFGEASGHAGGMGLWMTVGVAGNAVALIWIVLVGHLLFQSSRR